MENMQIVLPAVYGFVAGGATLVGLLLTFMMRKFVKKYSFAIVSVAAGVLLTTTFIHVLPEAGEMIGGKSYLWLLAGFGLFYFLESLIGCHCGNYDCSNSEIRRHKKNHVLGSVASAGLLMHSLLDGIAIAVGFEVSTGLGIITALAVIVHELPEGIFTLSILLHSGMKKTRAVWWTVFVALATPLGTLLTLFLFPDLGEKTLGILLAVTAGSFLYIATTNLIPETHKRRSLATGAFVLIGFLMVFAINNFIGHGHEHGHEQGYDQGHEQDQENADEDEHGIDGIDEHDNS